MKRHLNTLYVTTQGSYLSKEGETVSVKAGEAAKVRIPIHNLASIVCFGNVLCTPFLLGLCGERGVSVSFLTTRGRFLARMEGPVSGNVLLRREQYRRADAEGGVGIAQNVVIAKVANSRSLLMRALRDHRKASGVERIESAQRAMGRLLHSLRIGMSIDSVRGVEGAAAREYFGCFPDLILHQKADFVFDGRSRRPPLDNVNCLLSFLYTLLLGDCVGALQSVGLDPQVGFLHLDRPGRPSLALDLMEEFRAFVADRLALSLVNRRQIRKSHFVIKETGAVLLTKEGRRRVIVAYQKRKNDDLRHPFLGDRTTVGLLPHLQALLLARHLRGDLDGYPPFVAR